MPDASVTASSVIKTSTTKSTTKTAGVTITAGQVLCRNNSTGKIELADVNGASSYMKTVVGVALHGATANQPIEYAYEGDLTFNAGLTKGTIYVGSSNAGGLAPSTDLASGHTVSIVGAASSTTNLQIKLNNTGIEI